MLKEHRRKKGYSQEKLARETEVTLRTIQNIERKNNTDVQTAIKIAKILKTPVEVIFWEKEKKE